MNAHISLLLYTESYVEIFGRLKVCNNSEVRMWEWGKWGCSPFITDKRCYWIKCKYWGWPEIGCKEVKNWIGLQCGNQRQKKRINFIFRRCYKPQKCTWLRNYNLEDSMKVNNFKISTYIFNINTLRTGEADLRF